MLDDDPCRHQAFGERLAQDEVVHAHGYAEAVAALACTRFDLAYLDHDLTDFQPVPSGELDRTGLDVARFIARDLASRLRPAQVVIHSWNEGGAAQMAQVLGEAGVSVRLEPFEEKPGG